MDEDFFEELEEILLQADVGFETVMELMDALRFEVQRKNIKDTAGIQSVISEKLVEIYEAGEENITELNLEEDGLICYFICRSKWCWENNDYRETCTSSKRGR